MSEFDWNYVNTLLSVIHQAAGAGPKFAGIVSAATADLEAYMAPQEPLPENEVTEEDA